MSSDPNQVSRATTPLKVDELTAFKVKELIDSEDREHHTIPYRLNIWAKGEILYAMSIDQFTTIPLEDMFAKINFFYLYRVKIIFRPGECAGHERCP